MLNVKPIMVIFLIVLLSTSIAFAAKNVISTNPIINDTIEEVIEDIVVETANNEIIVSDNAIVVPIEPVPVSIQEKKTLPIEPKPVQNIDIRKINVTDKELKKVPIKPIILASVVPQWSNEIAIPSSPTYYEDGKSYQFSIDWIDDVGIDNVYLEFNGIWYDYSSGNISKTGSTYYKILTGLSIDTHEYNWSARDADMNWNVTGPRQYVIKDPAPQLTLNGISNNLTITYGTTSTTFAACDIGLVILKRNATSVVNPEIMVLATGTYNYTATCEMTGKSRTYFLTVNKATPIINLVLTNGTASWNHDPWKYRKKLTFNNLVSSENLVNFPVLVHVNSTTISKFKSDGSDIRFFDSTDMNELSYEIEQWNSTDGFVWVKIPFITAKNNTSYIYIYYGNPSATNGQNINDVWSNNYTTVYHLANRAGNNYANSNISAGSSGIDSASVHVMSGVIGNASKFAIANASYINIGDGADVRNIRTVEAWATKTSSTEYQTVMGKYNNGGGPGWYLAFYGGIIRLMNNNDGQGHIVTATQGSSLNVPIYYAVTTNGSQEALYQYGVLNATTSYGWNSLVPFVGQNMWIGGVGVAPPTMTYFDGTIDEIRLSAISRSTYWIKATYLSQTEQFVSIGSEEQPQGGSGSIVIYPNLANATATLNINDIFFLERNGTIVASGTNLLNELIRLPVSTYNYTAYYEGNENYTAVSISNNLTVERGTPDMAFGLLPISPITYGTPTIASCIIFNNTEQTVTLYRDDINVTSDENNVPLVLPAGVYNYTCSVPQTENYTEKSITNNSYTVSKQTPLLNLTATPSWIVNYPTETTVTAIETNEGDSDLIYDLSRDGASISSPDVNTFDLGLYVYNYATLGGENYTAGYMQKTLEVKDLIPPIVTITNPINDSYTGKNVWLNVTTNEVSSCFYYQLPYQVSTMGSPGTSYSEFLTNLSYGLNTYYVNCTDAYNNTGTASVHWYVTKQYSFYLQPGWNFISVAYNQYNTSISKVLESIDGKYGVVKYYNTTDYMGPWKTYRPGTTTNDLFELDNKMGFWINIIEPVPVLYTVSGINPATTQIQLKTGYNMVGYPSFTTRSVEEALQGIDWIRVETSDGGTDIRVMAPTELMNPNKAYWIKVDNDTSWNINW